MTDPYATTHEDWDPPADEPTPEDLEAPRHKPIDPRTLPARFHHLRAAGVSGAHCLLAFQRESSDSLSKRLGSGVHAIAFGKPWALWDQPSEASVKRRDKAEREGKPLPPLTPAPRSGKDWIAFVAKNAGAVIMTKSELAAAQRMASAILSHSRAAELLFAGDPIHERSIVWAQNGRARQSTPDVRDDARLVELKTTRSAHPAFFLRDAVKMAYHAQLADQRAAVRHETGRAPRETFIVAVENTPPHVVQVFDVRLSALKEGARLAAHWLERLQIYEMTDAWGGYSEADEPWEIVDQPDSPFPDPQWLATEEVSAG
jgi:hypothetical protein